MKITLKDWREDANGQIDVTVATNTDRIDIAAPDGRLVWIELEGDALRVHAYDPAHDAPVYLAIKADTIDICAHDRDAERGT